MASKRKGPRRKALTPQEALRRLGKMTTKALEESGSDIPTGRCEYTTSSGEHCARLTKAWCDQLHGTWTEGEDC
jgi:hypothetical protein